MFLYLCLCGCSEESGEEGRGGEVGRRRSSREKRGCRVGESHPAPPRRRAYFELRGQLAPPRRRAYFEQEPERGAASSMVAEIFITRTTWDVDTLRHMIIVAFVCLLFG